MHDSPHDRAEQSARETIEALGTQLGERELMTLQCARSHHIGAVYDTPRGPVVRLHLGPRSHGSKDFVSTAHGASEHGEYVDFLTPDVPGVDDRLPGWCACGGWTLSRESLRRSVTARERTVRVE